jgi:hypothetical protein
MVSVEETETFDEGEFLLVSPVISSQLSCATLFSSRFDWVIRVMKTLLQTLAFKLSSFHELKNRMKRERGANRVDKPEM